MAIEKNMVGEIILHALTEAGDIVAAGGEFPRTLFAAAGERHYQLECPAVGEDKERHTLEIMALILDVLDVDQYAIISETWTSTSPAHSRAAGGMPMNDPKRGEAITGILCRRVIGESGAPFEIRNIARRIITRVGDQILVGPIEAPEYSALDGRLFRLLPKLGRPPVSEVVAQRVREMVSKGSMS